MESQGWARIPGPAVAQAHGRHERPLGRCRKPARLVGIFLRVAATTPGESACTALTTLLD